MRTLSRPMFNMGGPIKQGIMHGIREPYRGGQLVRPGPGRPGYAGEAQAINAARWLATIGSRGTQAGGAANVFSNVGRTIGGVGSKISAATPGWLKSWIGRDPTAKGLGWGYKTLTGPTAKTWAGKALQGVTTPTGLLTAGYIGSKFLPDGTPKDVVTGVMKPGGYPGADKKIKKAQDAFAEAQKDTRVKKYLDMMGYDRSKKTAVADALIDASKIVSDRGTLETKNITRDLINPIIQATSKRFDKPEQIREAVGLMSVKAAITKDLEDPQVKKLRALQITDAEQKIAESASFEGGLSKFISDRKGKVDKITLERIARLLANEHKEPFTLVDETTVIGKEPGIYMSGGDIFRVDENGQAKQIA
jgi:hypothetical protein